MPTRWLVRSIAALCVTGLPSVAVAQSSALALARSTAPVVRVALTEDGTFASPEQALYPGLSIVDQQAADLDGDGDEDLLAFVDLDDDASVTDPGAGRGAVAFFREPDGWRARTVASVPALPFESAYNWGPLRVERGAPTARLLYSAADRGRFARASYRIRFDRDGAPVLCDAPPNGLAASAIRPRGRRTLARR
jgi:hypothetical protein